MKKIVYVLAVLLLTTPVLAADVDITCSVDGNEVTISYQANGGDANQPRGFGLNITVDSSATIDTITFEDPNYWVYPGSIDINDGNVIDYGTPVGDPCEYPDTGTLGGLGTGGITIEMGSLHYPPEVNSPNAPAASGPLLKFTVSADCNVAVTGNTARGNVVLYAATEADVSYTGCSVSLECYAGMADYAEWDEAGKPECWCYPRQCHGDADGKKQGSAYLGYTYVGTDDIDIVSLGWLVKDPPKGPGILDLEVNGVPVACADFAHDKQGSAYLGYARIGTNDIDRLSLYWLVKEPPKGLGTPADCLPGNRTP